MKISINNIYVVFFISVSYSILIIQLPILDAMDSQVYYRYASSSEIELIERFSHGVLFGILNEPIWLISNILINYFSFNNPETVMFTISFFISFIAAYYLYRYNKTYQDLIITLLVLSLPLFIANSISHLREGFAFAIFIIGFFSSNKIIKYWLILSTPFIHIGFALILIMYFSMLLVQKIRISFSLKLFSYLFIIVMLSILLFNFSSENIRQSTSESIGNITGSGMGFLFWSFYLLNLLINMNSKKINFYKVDKQIFMFSIITLIFYLCNYYYFYGVARILQNTVFFHVIALKYLKTNGKIIGSLMLILYIVYEWLSRFNQENLGF